MNVRAGCWALWLTCLLSRAAAGHGEPILVTAANGSLSTNALAYKSEFEFLASLTLSDVPGYSFEGFQFGDEVSFDIVDHLWYLTPELQVMPAPDALELLIERNTAPFPNVRVSHNPNHVHGQNQYAPGYLFETIDGLSGEHQHLLTYLFETGDVPDGAYGIVLRITSEGYEPTLPFLIAFGQGEINLDDAVNALAEVALFDGPLFIPGDFNDDKLVDAADIDLLYAHRGSDVPDKYDLAPDGIIDELDAAYWVQVIVGTEFGDVNLDGAIDIQDLNAVRNNFGSTGGWAVGDSDGSGVVDIADLNFVRNHFGFSAAGVSVPEPSGGVLAALFLAGGFGATWKLAYLFGGKLR